MLTWYHVTSYNTEPAKCYGFAVDERGVIVKANELVIAWVGKHLKVIEDFLKDKPVIISEIKIEE